MLSSVLSSLGSGIKPEYFTRPPEVIYNNIKSTLKSVFPRVTLCRFRRLSGSWPDLVAPDWLFS
jgi:hypothetical protein